MTPERLGEWLGHGIDIVGIAASLFMILFTLDTLASTWRLVP